MLKLTVMKKKILVGILIIAGIFLAKQIFGNTKVKVTPVKKVNLEQQVVNKTVSASGEVKSVHEANLAFPATQVITAIYVDKGDVVKKGQLLASLENGSVLETIQAAKDARDVAIRNRDLFINDKDNQKRVLGGQKAYDIKLRTYDELLSQAEASYQAQLLTNKNMYIYAPADGTVIDVTKKVGEIAIGGTPLIKLANVDEIQFEVSIDQSDFGYLKVGQTAEISLDAFPNTTFTGKILELPSFTNGNTSGSFLVELAIDPKEDKKILLGMTGDAKLTVATTQNPVAALYYDQIFFDEQDKPYVWVADNSYVTKLPVEIGLEGDVFTEVKTQIAKQIIVPVTADTEIKDGYRIKIVK